MYSNGRYVKEHDEREENIKTEGTMDNNELLGFSLGVREWNGPKHGAEILNLTYRKGQVTSQWIFIE